MTTPLLLAMSFGMAMDAFAVSVSNGMCYPRVNPYQNALVCGLTFGFFQALMPVIGYLAGHSFYDVVTALSHWVALILLCFLGGRMIAGSRKGAAPEARTSPQVYSVRLLVLQAFATSIDALALGIFLGVLHTPILPAAAVIGSVTFLCCFAGVLAGRKFRGLLAGRAELLGGLILIGIGIHIFLEAF